MQLSVVVKGLCVVWGQDKGQDRGPSQDKSTRLGLSFPILYETLWAVVQLGGLGVRRRWETNSAAGFDQCLFSPRSVDGRSHVMVVKNSFHYTYLKIHMRDLPH